MSENGINLHSLDEVLAALYSTISGGPGEQDWDSGKILFHPQSLTRDGG